MISNAGRLSFGRPVFDWVRAAVLPCRVLCRGVANGLRESSKISKSYSGVEKFGVLADLLLHRGKQVGKFGLSPMRY